VVGGFSLLGWGLLKSTTGNDEELRKKFQDKRTGEQRAALNETELMVEILRGGGEASLRCSRLPLTLSWLRDILREGI
jgi:hypothetical protein